jgi:two-component system, cell cycle sensor histidine kinase and response regulator CckA
VVGGNPRVLKSGVQDAAFYQELWGTIAAGRQWTGTLHNRRKDGSLFWELARIAPVADAAGRTTHYVAVKEDISQQRQLEEQLRQSQRLEAVGQLAGGVAHDFNNLLTVISGYATLLESDLPPGSEARSCLGEIQGAARRSADLTRQLLAFSRRQILQPQVLDLGVVVAGMEKMLRRLLGEDVRLGIEIAPELYDVEADPGQMEQVLMNLCVNARDAMPHGGRLRVRVRNRGVTQAEADGVPYDVKPGPYVMLEVEDEGSGMDEHTLRHIFEPFFSTKETGKGTGLGLSTVYGIVKQSGGYVWVTSEVGRGSVFQVLLPQCSAERGLQEGTDTPVIDDPWPARGRTRRVLLVEDDAAVRSLLTTILRNAGYDVCTAPDGRSAVELVKAMEQPVDLAILDVVMPGLNGSAVAESLRARWPDLPTLYISGYMDDAIVRNGIRYEEVEFLPKPIHPQELRKKVRQMLGEE